MIIEDQKIPVKITKRNIRHFSDIGYKNIKLKDTIIVNVNDLTKGSHTKVKVLCDYCGKIVDVCYKDYVNCKYDKYACSSCRPIKSSEYSLSKRQDSLYERALSFCNEMGYNLLTPRTKIMNSTTRVLYECPKHGIKNTKVYTLITRHRCIDCGHDNTSKTHLNNTEDVYEYFKKHGSVLLNKEDYKRWDIKNLKVVCRECGEIFTTSYGSFSHSNGRQVCPKCSSTISTGELKVKNFLIDSNVDFQMQYRFKDCKNKVALPFDFYLPKINTCIEYDGEGHYIPIQRGMSLEEAEIVLSEIKYRDAIKTEYCQNNNIGLIRIPYWEYENIEQILTKELFT